MTGTRTRIDATELARQLRLPEPTEEQARVIAADLEPCAVIAGAGSGKSETMAARVVWLVANGVVRPEQVLGLTFTRKAAAELATRVRGRLDQLRDLGLVPPEVLDGEPTVSTYHSYAARLFVEHALREAREPTTRLITPAIQWQLAARVVASYDGPMDAVTWTPATVTAAVLELAGELAEHLRSADDVRAEGERLRARAGALRGRVPVAVTKLLRCAEAREQLLTLVERYEREKVEREVMDHGDQVALAARIAARHPEVGAVERSRYAVVLLDEYQDTGHSQLVLLRSLYAGGHPVTAVGDPCQSIYGWRGASAGNLRRFPRDFPRRSGEPAALVQLSTSFRNGERVLVPAARLSAELRTEVVGIPELRPGPDRARRGRVVCGLFASARAEAAWVAERVAAVLEAPEGLAPDGRPWPNSERRTRGSGEDRPWGAPAERAEKLTIRWGERRGKPAKVRPADVAVLARKRAQFPALRRALEERGIPVEVVGLGGLLTVPEVQDVVATLRVLRDPASSDALARLLTGPRWRIGPRDLVALGARARELARTDGRDLDGEAGGQEVPSADAGPGGVDAGPGEVDAGVADVGEGPPEPTDPLDAAVADMTTAGDTSLVDALDDLGAPERYSPVGYARLRALARELHELRTRLDQPLPDLITDVDRTLGLDIEVAARPGLDPVAARADLDALVDAAARFAGDTDEPTLGAFLAYLKAAEDQEFGLEGGRVSETDSVKLMTVHAAKGLEWPVVVVPGLAAGRSRNARVFPAAPRASTRWTDNPRKLPFRLRGDGADLPSLPDLDRESLERFAQECARRDELEERRLAYVAATRASYLLLCSGYWWGDGRTRLGPSVFLSEVRETCAAGTGEVAWWEPEPPEDAENPALAEAESAPWPADPDGPRHAAVVEGARLVEEALAGAGEAWLTEAEGVELPEPREPPDEPVEPEGAQGDGREPGADAVREASAADGEDTAGNEDTAAGGGDVSGGDGVSGEADRRRTAGWALDERLLLAERADASGGSRLAVELPDNLSVSALVTLARDPAELARQIRRPLPRPPAPHTRRGTAFHVWLESRYGQQRLLDPDEMPGAADEEAFDDEDLAELRRCFEASEWAARTPVDVEVRFETVIGDRLVRGRMDAVFRDGDGSYDVVDWKTGARPTGREAGVVSVQLAAYRLAWAALAGVPVEQVRAAFHYVRTNETVRPADLLDADGLAALVAGVPVIE